MSSPVVDGTRLSLHFVARHPRAAAAILEDQPPQAGAAFLAGIPSQTAAPLMAGMLPYCAARCLRLLAPEVGAALLAVMKPAAGVAILRQVSERRGADLIGRLPGRRAAAYRLMLGYPVTVVGAWMDARVPVLPDDDTVSSALRRLRREEWDLDRVLHVVDRDRLLKGRIRSAELLRSAMRSPLSTLVEAVPDHLKARSDLMTIRDLPAWDLGDPLPVVRRNGEFVGVLRHCDLRAGLRHDSGGDPYAGRGGALLRLAEAQWSGLGRLLEGSARLLPQEPSPDAVSGTSPRSKHDGR